MASTTDWSNHPAKFSESVIDAFCDTIERHALKPGLRVLDPFAGTGRIHWFEQFETWGVEIEPEGAAMHPRTICGDATNLPFADKSFDVIFTSPVYGNRMSDHFDARDDSVRHTYRHTLRRELHERNAGRMYFWQEAYKDLHRKAYQDMGRVIRPGGMIALNVSDFYRTERRGESPVLVRACLWHVDAMETYASAVLLEDVEVVTRRQQHGENRLRADCEHLFIFRAD